MDYETIEREIHIDASPEVVFDVVSSPEHLREWWPDEADFPAVPGGDGRIGFGDVNGGGGKWVRFTVVDAVPSRLFSFRWTPADGEAAPGNSKLAPGNSNLVVFELEPSGAGTLLRMTETGFRERGWDEETIAAEYQKHGNGWDVFLPRLPVYAAKVAAGR